jgi:hypothetical protein
MIRLCNFCRARIFAPGDGGECMICGSHDHSPSSDEAAAPSGA